MTIEAIHQRFLECSGSCTDTRRILNGGMFFALRGPNFDANKLAADALNAGCRHAVVDDASIARDERYIVVADVLATLQALGRHHRRSFHIPVLGITGSNGKTTTKELIHAVLNADRHTLATSGNLNNHIGVPLTLLRLNAEHRFAIIEMGANKPGDIAELCAIAEPTHGLITNIGKAHLEGFGSVDGVIRTKTELYAFIKSHGGALFVNGDDALLMEKSAGIARLTYGQGDDHDVKGTLDEQRPGDEPGIRIRFRSRTKDGEMRVRSRLVGAYNLSNVLASVGVGQHFGVPDATIVRALEAYTPSNNRSQFSDTGRNHLVLDAYNANPSSMRAALENFAAMATERPKLALLGGMKELGEYETAEHQALVDLVRSLKIEAVFIGPEFAAVNVQGARTYATADEALQELEHNPVTGRTILVKGSRGTKLETLVPAL